MPVLTLVHTVWIYLKRRSGLKLKIRVSALIMYEENETVMLVSMYVNTLASKYVCYGRDMFSACANHMAIVESPGKL